MLLPVASQAQSFNGYLSGTVLGPVRIAGRHTALVLRNTGTGVESRRSSEADGSYAFPNLVPGTYEVTAEFLGIEPTRPGIAGGLPTARCASTSFWPWPVRPRRSRS